ncbi:hypothetical protein F442_23060, partial [Phytophthora nicotianae P10297]
MSESDKVELTHHDKDCSDASERSVDHEAKESEDTATSVGDLNIFLPGEQPEDFACLDSDDDTDGTTRFEEEEDLGPCEPAAEDYATAPDLHFDQQFLGSVGDIARGNVGKDVLKDIKENWIEDDYPGIYTGEHGPTPAALVAAETPLVVVV